MGLKILGGQARVNLQTGDLGTAKQNHFAENAIHLNTDNEKLNHILRERFKTHPESESQLAAGTRHLLMPPEFY